ncbi:MFS general substrate transporter, partial [Atractiella rhizophila]
MARSLSSASDLDNKSPSSDGFSDGDRKEAYEDLPVSAEVKGAMDMHDIPPVDPKVESKILRKFDLWLLALLATMYLCNALDKTNLGNAKTDGFDKAIGLVGNQYYQLITAFYAPFCVMGTPITILIKKFTAARVLPIMALSFGALSMCSAAVKNFGGILTIRLLLAVAEAAVLPGTIFYLSTFYTRAELARRVGIFYAAASIAGAFGGLIAYGVFQAKHAALQGWQILFLTEGGFTIFVAILMALILPRSPSHARFLSEEEKAICEARLLRDGTTEITSNTTVKQAFKQILTEWQTIFWFGIE